jgi:hypothetical protein
MRGGQTIRHPGLESLAGAFLLLDALRQTAARLMALSAVALEQDQDDTPAAGRMGGGGG